MSQSLSRSQAVMLGLVVMLALALGGYGIARIADKQGLWTDTIELTAGFTEAHDITPGTPVRIRGIDVGQVIGVDYPDHDGAGAEVIVRMRVPTAYAHRIYADASAQIHTSGLLGSKVISIQPGHPNSGALAGHRLRGINPTDLNALAAEVRELAQQAKNTTREVKALAADTRATVSRANSLFHDIQTSDGTLAKLIRDDDLYTDARGTLADLRSLITRADRAIGKLEAEADELHLFVSDGRDTLRSVKQGTDAIGKMPIIRNYVEDSAALLVRPTMSREKFSFYSGHLFEPGSAIFTPEGLAHMANLVNHLNARKVPGSEIVVAAFFDPHDQSQTAAAALELTRKQAEAVAHHFKQHNVHKLGVIARRKIIPLGMGTGRSPVVDTEKLPPSHIEIHLFTPR
ncbi:MAG: MlaD family protein [Gemmataceae bacterium]|nr:MlaD family protein [Gemmata sp.]MDW8197604.1 MlaD family protein [Gemmataceae bacterium]